jgi:predicted nuclease of predicted toxin-antitoxin system
MPRTICFHLDEHGAKALANGLRRLGIDVTTTFEVGLAGASDEEQLAYSLAQGRVIFTQDDDFLCIHAAGIPHAGIAYCHQESRSVGELIRGLVLMWEIYDTEEVRNRIEYL